MLVGCSALLIIGVSLGLLAGLRIHEARVFSRPHSVRTYSGTNYIVQITEATVGQTGTGCVLIIYLRLQNPNPYEVVLPRKMFVLMDQAKDYFLPSTAGTQSELITLAANGVLDREMLSFEVPNDAFIGTVALMIGHNYMVLVKDEGPYQVTLRNGEFRSFHRRSW